MTEKIAKAIVIGFFFLSISYGENQKAVSPPKGWVRRVIHQPDNPPPYTNYTPGEIAIGDARNDGINRLYCANLNNDLVEYTWTGTGWVKTTIFSGTKFTYMVIGKARATDNLNRIYCYRPRTGKLYEISYENGNWTMQEIPLPIIPSGHFVTSIITGDGRNDGVNRLYISTSQFKTYEFRYNGNEWVLESIVSDHIEIYSLGDGRGDGVNRFYGVTEVDSLFEITYSNGVWEENLIGINPNPDENGLEGFLCEPCLFDFGDIGPMVITKGGYDDILYAFKYNPTTRIWEVTTMHSDANSYAYGFGGAFKYCDVMVDPRSPLFKKNLYIPAVPEEAGQHGDTLYIHEFSYDPRRKTWTRNVISYISVAPGPQFSCVKCGNIRGKDCIYAICEDGTIVEISYE